MPSVTLQRISTGNLAGLQGFVASTVSAYAPLLSDSSATFGVPEFKISPITRGGTVSLTVKGALPAFSKIIQVENVSGGMSGFIPEGSIVFIQSSPDAQSHVVGADSTISSSVLELSIVGGLTSALLGGEAVTSDSTPVVVQNTSELSVENYHNPNDDGVVKFGFQFATKDVKVRPRVGWHCDRRGQKGNVILVDSTPHITVVWIGTRARV